MTLHDLILVKPLVFSTYPYLFDKGNKRKAKWANNPDIRPLLKFRLVEMSVPLDVGGKIYQVQVTLLAGHTAVIFRGMNKGRWKLPILCFDGEALCYELHLWREREGLEPELSASACQAAKDLENADTKEEQIEKWLEIAGEVISDPYCERLTELAYNLEALSLIESLPQGR